ncbi:MAG: hypothetical protein IJQ67_00555 [Bacilli bacterium]|nr:hypothetical protein [Bacilli bacterium]
MIEPLFAGENLENPFAPSIEHYESIVAFMKDAKKWAHNFMKAIPENPGTDKIMFWNDTATNPAVRFEFHVIKNKDEYEYITYQVKVNRKGEPVFIVTMDRGIPKKFSDEKEALELVTILYKTIRGIK